MFAVMIEKFNLIITLHIPNFAKSIFYRQFLDNNQTTMQTNNLGNGLDPDGNGNGGVGNGGTGGSTSGNTGQTPPFSTNP